MLVKEELKAAHSRLFIKAIKNIENHIIIGEHFYEGKEGFPKDVNQAIKHFLKFAITFIVKNQLHLKVTYHDYFTAICICRNDSNMSKTMTYLKKIKLEEERKRAISYDYANDLLIDDLSVASGKFNFKNYLDEAITQLNNIEAIHGKKSVYEYKVSTLSTTCLEYIANNSVLFSGKVIKEKLPMDLIEYIDLDKILSDAPSMPTS